MDLATKLFIELISWKNPVVSELKLQITELQEFEKRMETIKAIEDVFGMLNELTEDQLEAFDESINRRPLFK